MHSMPPNQKAQLMPKPSAETAMAWSKLANSKKATCRKPSPNAAVCSIGRARARRGDLLVLRNTEQRYF